MIFTFGKLWIVRLMAKVFIVIHAHVGINPAGHVQHVRMEPVWMSISEACKGNQIKFSELVLVAYFTPSAHE